MAANIVYFDLETQRSAQDVGGWRNIPKMGLAIASTYNTREGAYHIYTEQEVDALIQELRRADCVVGFNIVHFDYAVLAPYSLFDFSQVPTLDLLLSIEKTLGYRLSLDSVAEASLGINKTADGMESLRWWKQGKVREVAEYCCYDVKTTRLVHEFGVQEGKVYYVDSRTKLKREIPVQWKIAA